MKLLLALCAANALAHAPPRIELDLAAVPNHVKGWHSHYADAPHYAPLEADADHGHMYSSSLDNIITGTTANPLPGKDPTRRDWSARCPAGTSTTISTCPFPVAKAYDHQDKDISNRIVTSVFLINSDGNDCSDPAKRSSTDTTLCQCDDDTNNHCAVSQVFFGKRAQYLFLYDVQDSAGNNAEQVVYMLELDDTTAPSITICDGSDAAVALTWEATNGETLCYDTAPDDNLDDASDMTLHYRILQKKNGKWVLPYNDAACVGDDCTVSECKAGVELHPVAPDGKWLKFSLNSEDKWAEDSDGYYNTSHWFPYSAYAAAGNDGDATDGDAAKTCLGEALKNNFGKSSGVPNAVGVGEFLIYYRVCDNAGKYARYAGQSGVDGWHDNNCVMTEQVITIEDNTKPWIVLRDAAVRVKECYKDGTTEVNPDDDDAETFFGAHVNFTDVFETGTHAGEHAFVAKDRLDTETLNDSPLNSVVTYQGPSGISSDPENIDVSQVSDNQYVIYNANDVQHTAEYSSDQAKAADEVKRQISVVDRLRPTITLVPFNSSSDMVLFVADDCGADHFTGNTTHSDQHDASAHPFTCTKGPHNKNTQDFVYNVAAGNSRSSNDVEPGWTCEDDCDTNPTEHDVTWGSKTLELDTTGVYTATYKCTDYSTNEHIVTRDFQVIDSGKPWIEVVGERIVTIEATLEYTYTDEGAMCTDTIDGSLGSAIVKGDTVDITNTGAGYVPTENTTAYKHSLGAGHYVIEYACIDNSGNEAVEQYRTVVVVDTTCPVVSLKGDQEVTLEAGFTFQDPGATAVDYLGTTQTLDYSSDIETFGDTVDASQTMHYTSCMEISKYYAGANSGPYYVVRMDNDNRLERVLVECIFNTQEQQGGAKPQGITYKRLSGAKPTIPYDSTDGVCPNTNADCQGDCPAFGLKMLEKASLPAFASEHMLNNEVQYYNAAQSTSEYLCGILGEASTGPTGSMILVNGTDSSELKLQQALHAWHPANPNSGTLCAGGQDCALERNTAGEAASNSSAHVDAVDWTGMAHQGVYVITYRVKDSQGNYNDQCNAACNSVHHPRLAGSSFAQLAHSGSGTAACCGRMSTYHIGWESRKVPHTQCGNNGTIVRRTVTVQDTLPPVITLHLKKNSQWERIQTSASTAENPAGTAENPYIHSNWRNYNSHFSLMAQQGNSMNGWMVGAIVSGVAGIALLAASFRRNTPVVVEV